MIEGALQRQVGRAVALPHRGALHVAARRRVPQEDLLRRRAEVLALHDLERPPIDHPPRHERALGAVRARDADGGGELVIHHERELVVAADERAQAVGNPDHPIALDHVADGEDGHRAHAGEARNEIGIHGGAGADVVARGHVGAQQRGAGQHQRRRGECPLEECPSSEPSCRSWLHAASPAEVET